MDGPPLVESCWSTKFRGRNFYRTPAPGVNARRVSMQARVSVRRRSQQPSERSLPGRSRHHRARASDAPQPTAPEEVLEECDRERSGEMIATLGPVQARVDQWVGHAFEPLHLEAELFEHSATVTGQPIPLVRECQVAALQQ